MCVYNNRKYRRRRTFRMDGHLMHRIQLQTFFSLFIREKLYRHGSNRITVFWTYRNKYAESFMICHEHTHTHNNNWNEKISLGESFHGMNFSSLSVLRRRRRKKNQRGTAGGTLLWITRSFSGKMKKVIQQISGFFLSSINRWKKKK